jgi:hypothetical protein
MSRTGLVDPATKDSTKTVTIKAEAFDRFALSFALKLRKSGDLCAWFEYNGKTLTRTRRSKEAGELLMDYSIRQHLQRHKPQVRDAIGCRLIPKGYREILLRLAPKRRLRTSSGPRVHGCLADPALIMAMMIAMSAFRRWPRHIPCRQPEDRLCRQDGEVRIDFEANAVVAHGFRRRQRCPTAHTRVDDRPPAYWPCAPDELAQASLGLQ